jgi:hypothetical protein
MRADSKWAWRWLALLNSHGRAHAPNSLGNFRTSSRVTALRPHGKREQHNDQTDDSYDELFENPCDHESYSKGKFSPTPRRTSKVPYFF